MKAEHKYEVQEKKLVDTALAIAMFVIGLVVMMYGFITVLAEIAPSLQLSGSEIIIGAVVFIVSIYFFRYHV